MRLITASGLVRRGGLSPLAGLFILLAAAALPPPVPAAQNSQIRLLYFFSSSCRHCVDAKPFVIALSREFSLEGLHFGQGPFPEYPFPVKEGDKKIARERYGVVGVPAMAVMVDGKYKQKIEGTADIRDAKVLVKALSEGAKTVSEATAAIPETEIEITGWIIARGEYFKGAQFFITDRKTALRVKAWLPLEVVKSPFQSRRPRLMSDVVNKPVVLRGSIKKTKDGFLLLVIEELLD
jgi:hypothetical protein